MRTSCLWRCESTVTTPCRCTAASTRQTERAQSGACSLALLPLPSPSSCPRDYKSGVVDVLVCTSIAARGLDVPNLRLVVNFDCPNHYEDYVHRVGRTGRAGARPHNAHLHLSRFKRYWFTLVSVKEGTAYTFVTPRARALFTRSRQGAREE